MARETKVGLLAGLAFIICFAIILANRGRQHLIPAQLTYLDRSHADLGHELVDDASYAQGDAIRLFHSGYSNQPF